MATIKISNLHPTASEILFAKLTVSEQNGIAGGALYIASGRRTSRKKRATYDWGMVSWCYEEFGPGAKDSLGRDKSSSSGLRHCVSKARKIN